MVSPSQAFARRSYECRTPRLLIRTPTSVDEEVYYTLSTDQKNYPYEKAETELTRETITEFIKNMPEYSSAGAAAFFVIELCETGEVIGLCGYNVFESQKPAEFLKNPDAGSEPMWQTDIGITIGHKHWRKGYGIEAFCGLLEFAHRELGCKLFRVETGLANHPWVNLMERLGLSAFKKSDRSIIEDEKEVWDWRFDIEDWAKAVRAMVKTGKWPLASV
uniref:N-acetyltransferase domain-containing protein n=1 Tax=Bionectria ochroleuca TaxID=29856 RepID=A0A8H7TUD9_BIOOC